MLKLHPLIGLITVLTVLLLGVTAWAVGRARGRYGVKAPATTGPEDFERIFRMQANTHEAALMFLPALWTAASFGAVWISALLGAVWLLARAWYAVAYSRPQGRRGPGFILGTAALFGLLVQAAWGIAWTWALA